MLAGAQQGAAGAEELGFAAPAALNLSRSLLGGGSKKPRTQVQHRPPHAPSPLHLPPPQPHQKRQVILVEQEPGRESVALRHLPRSLALRASVLPRRPLHQLCVPRLCCCRTRRPKAGRSGAQLPPPAAAARASGGARLTPPCPAPFMLQAPQQWQATLLLTRGRHTRRRPTIPRRLRVSTRAWVAAAARGCFAHLHKKLSCSARQRIDFSRFPSLPCRLPLRCVGAAARPGRAGG